MRCCIGRPQSDHRRSAKGQNAILRFCFLSYRTVGGGGGLRFRSGDLAGTRHRSRCQLQTFTQMLWSYWRCFGGTSTTVARGELYGGPSGPSGKRAGILAGKWPFGKAKLPNSDLSHVISPGTFGLKRPSLACSWTAPPRWATSRFQKFKGTRAPSKDKLPCEPRILS